jgi:hypothetical protein
LGGGLRVIHARRASQMRSRRLERQGAGFFLPRVSVLRRWVRYRLERPHAGLIEVRYAIDRDRPSGTSFIIVSRKMTTAVRTFAVACVISMVGALGRKP